MSGDNSSFTRFHPEWFIGSFPATNPIGSFEASNSGLFDISGNAAEWCFDVYDYSYYSVSPTTDPKGPVTGISRVIRGGSWYDYAIDASVYFRQSDMANQRSDYTGFRVVHSD